MGERLDDRVTGFGFSQVTEAQLNLGPLQVNGTGTPTYLPGPASVAIDHGDNSTCLANDQRGETRPFDGDGDGTATCDAGSVEVQALLL